MVPLLLAAAAWMADPSGESSQPDPARLARIHAAEMPKITQPVMFNTPEADAICAALEVFPADNPWNPSIRYK